MSLNNVSGTESSINGGNESGIKSRINDGTKTRKLLFSPIVLANIAVLVTAFFWGVSFISTKIILNELPPVTIALIRFAIASLVLGILFVKVEPQTKLERKDFPLMFIGGILGITLYFYLENTGISLTTASNASLITAFVPFITILLDMIFFHSRATALKVIGVVFALVGTYFTVTANGQISFTSDNFAGNLFMVGAMLSWAFYTLDNKFLQRKYSGLCLITYQTVFGTLCLIPLALTEMNEWKTFSLVSLGHILFLALCCSVAAYLFYVYALKHLDVTVTIIYMNLIPVFGVASGYLILGESVLPIQLVGGLITIIAIIAANLEGIGTRVHSAGLSRECQGELSRGCQGDGVVDTRKCQGELSRGRGC